MKLVAKIELSGHSLAPWAAPNVAHGRTKNNNRYTFTSKPKALTAFQNALKRNAKATMKATPPYFGPVYLRTKIVKATEDRTLWGQWCFPTAAEGSKRSSKEKRGDLTNLVKAIEDSAKKIVFTDDDFVVGQNNLIVWGEHDSVELTVLAIGPADALSN